MANIEIIPTTDGSHSLFHKELNETFHSRHGALQESRHVFIKNGLLPALEKLQRTVCVLEVGFGTGLNALLTWQTAAERKRQVEYVSLEPFPLAEEIWGQLNYGAHLQMKHEFSTLHTAPWNKKEVMSEYFTLTKWQTTWQQADIANDCFDVIYFDAFAPEKQPELWHPSVFTRAKALLREGGALVTYCAKGQVKRDLRAAGFQVESLPGPPGKREMIRCWV